MLLSDLDQYSKITIQCHDNPDADAIASAFGLYKFFQSKDKNVSIVYSGRNSIQKSNLLLMIEKLSIPVEYMPDTSYKLQGALITVDCQYGAGNVTRIQADFVVSIDHHQIEVEYADVSEIQPFLGSCSTLVWNLLQDAGFDVNNDKKLGTAFYYGLMTDTNQFAELYNPLDRDMRDEVVYDKTLISLFCNSNLSLKELEIAGIALLRYIFNDDHNYAIVHAQPCDPNILGLISDLILQVDQVKVCVVYNEVPDGYKVSVRSCVKEVRASELAVFLMENIGTGGGHIDKAGGFISMMKYEELYHTVHTESYFGTKLNEYFETQTIIYAKDYCMDTSAMKSYVKKKIKIGFADPSQFLEVGTPITIRTLEGDVDTKVDGDFYVMIGLKGEVYPIKKEKFNKTYEILNEPYQFDAEYKPNVRSRLDGKAWDLVKYAKTCRATGVSYIMAKEIKETVKIFTVWDEEKYMLGKPRDFIACRSDDVHDIYVVERDIFFKTYEPC